MPKRDADIAALEAELRDVRAEQKRLARAVALADDLPELVTELRQLADLQAPARPVRFPPCIAALDGWKTEIGDARRGFDERAYAEIR